ncbi:unnamed protein product [Pedinophyceae sp. YPF-701]|nr:unnamed protein product [Pedinophyceae sp. YPF-701]
MSGHGMQQSAECKLPPLSLRHLPKMDALTLKERLTVVAEARAAERSGTARELREALSGAPRSVTAQLWQSCGLAPKLLGEKRQKLQDDTEGTRMTRRGFVGFGYTHMGARAPRGRGGRGRRAKGPLCPRSVRQYAMEEFHGPKTIEKGAQGAPEQAGTEAPKKRRGKKKDAQAAQAPDAGLGPALHAAPALLPAHAGAAPSGPPAAQGPLDAAALPDAGVQEAPALLSAPPKPASRGAGRGRQGGGKAASARGAGGATAAGRKQGGSERPPPAARGRAAAAAAPAPPPAEDVEEEVVVDCGVCGRECVDAEGSEGGTDAEPPGEWDFCGQAGCSLRVHTACFAALIGIEQHPSGIPIYCAEHAPRPRGTGGSSRRRAPPRLPYDDDDDEPPAKDSAPKGQAGRGAAKGARGRGAEKRPASAPATAAAAAKARSRPAPKPIQPPSPSQEESSEEQRPEHALSDEALAMLLHQELNSGGSRRTRAQRGPDGALASDVIADVLSPELIAKRRRGAGSRAGATPRANEKARGTPLPEVDEAAALDPGVVERVEAAAEREAEAGGDAVAAHASAGALPVAGDGADAGVPAREEAGGDAEGERAPVDAVMEEPDAVQGGAEPCEGGGVQDGAGGGVDEGKAREADAGAGTAEGCADVEMAGDGGGVAGAGVSKSEEVGDVAAAAEQDAGDGIAQQGGAEAAAHDHPPAEGGDVAPADAMEAAVHNAAGGDEQRGGADDMVEDAKGEVAAGAAGEGGSVGAGEGGVAAGGPELAPEQARRAESGGEAQGAAESKSADAQRAAPERDPAPHPEGAVEPGGSSREPERVQQDGDGAGGAEVQGAVAPERPEGPEPQE